MPFKRRADFVAHVGQELALGHAGRLGGFLGRLLGRLGLLAVGDVFDRPFVIEQLAVGIADFASVLRDPADLAVLAIDLRLEAVHASVRGHRPNEVLAPPIVDVELAADVGHAGLEFVGRLVAVGPCQGVVGAEILSGRSGLEDPHHRIFENAAVFLFGLLQSALELLALGDVGVNSQHADHLAGSVANRHLADQQRALLPSA